VIVSQKIASINKLLFKPCIEKPIKDIRHKPKVVLDAAGMMDLMKSTGIDVFERECIPD
jgi:hypothetical protein